MEKRIGTIYPPEKPEAIPYSSQWIFGQGAGAWFFITKTRLDNQFNIRRYTPKGSLDCDRVFEVEGNGSAFDIGKSYEFNHLSHCAKCRIKQDEKVFIFNYIGE